MPLIVDIQKRKVAFWRYRINVTVEMEQRFPVSLLTILALGYVTFPRFILWHSATEST